MVTKNRKISTSARRSIEHSRLAGRLFVFEGADGAGKTTVVRETCRLLTSQGVWCETFAFPGAEPGRIGKLVHKLHHSPGSYGIESISPASLQALHVAAHIDSIQRSIAPSLKSGACVLLDRYWWSTFVYGTIAGIPSSVLQALVRVERLVWGPVRPDLVVLVKRGGRSLALEKEYSRIADRERRSTKVVQIVNEGTLRHACEAIIRAMLSASR